MEESRLDYLISAFLTNGLTSEERQEMKDLLKEPSNKSYFKQLYSIDLVAKNASSYDNTDKVYDDILSQIDFDDSFEVAARKRYFDFSWRNIAAVALFVLMFGAGMYYWGSNNNETIVADNNVINVPLGSQSTISLPDGSTVTLNSGSRIEYSSTFGQKDRILKLEGEAFFNVAKNKEKAFVVYAKNSAVEVLGTVFNVKAYADEELVTATLVEGSVKVIPNINDLSHDNIVLKVNETVSIDTKNNATQVQLLQNVNTLLYTSWKDTRWIIQGEQMESLAKKLERRYSVSIKIDDELKKYKFSGTIVDETLEQTLEIMKSIAPISYVLDKKNVFISVDSNKRKAFEQSITQKE